MIVAGPSASGKTVLSRRLAGELALPLITRDALKELMFDGFGWDDQRLTQQIDAVSYRLVYHCLEVVVGAGGSCIVESNFVPAVESAHFLALRDRAPFRTLQIQCHAAPPVLVERFLHRRMSGERHPGHVDTAEVAAADASMARGRSDPLAIAGPIVELDTTDFATVDYGALVAHVRHLLAT